ncbi:unnamed protein product [Tenebrio molitor]|nr:unnamed protein product [Tenebrio molitor]
MNIALLVQNVCGLGQLAKVKKCRAITQILSRFARGASSKTTEMPKKNLDGLQQPHLRLLGPDLLIYVKTKECLTFHCCHSSEVSTLWRF